jgi:hypothetical protein
MDGQLSFATLDYAGKKKRTKRDVFLTEMAAAVPWSVLEAVIAPHYPKEGPQGGRRAFPIAVMLRIYCLQQWYNLSDPGAEEALYDIQLMRAFCNLELGRDPIPDKTTILNFRHLLEPHELTKTAISRIVPGAAFQRSGLGRYNASFLARRAFMLPVGRRWLAAVLAVGFCTAASADDVLFENVRIFDGKSAALSAPSNVLVKGNIIERISTAPIEVAGALTYRRKRAHADARPDRQSLARDVGASDTGTIVR